MRDDRYAPMEAALAQPAPPEETVPPLAEQPRVPLRAFFAELRGVLSGNFGWACAAAALPVLVYATRVAIHAATEGMDAMANLVAFAAEYLVCIPLNYGAEGAILWRFAGSAAHGPLRRGPVLGLFSGFRFFAPLFLFDVLSLMCSLALYAPPGIVLWAGLSRGEWGGFASFADRPEEWMVLFCSIPPLVALWGFVVTRWIAALPLAVAEGKPFSAAIAGSEALVRGRMRATFAFLAIVSLGFGIVSGTAGIWFDLRSTLLGVETQGPLWWPFAIAPLRLLVWVIGSAAAVAAYRVLAKPPVTGAGHRLALGPVGRSGYAVFAGYLGALSLLPGMGPFAILFGVITLRQLRLEPGRLGRGRAIFCIAAGAASTLAYGVLIAVIMSDVYLESSFFSW